jgi:hypothetical protein
MIDENNGVLKTVTMGRTEATHTLMSTLLRLAGSILGKAHGLSPDEWGRANITLPL